MYLFGLMVSANENNLPIRSVRAVLADLLRKAFSSRPKLTLFSTNDPKTTHPWWQTMTPKGVYPELRLAQREEFYVLLVDDGVRWAAFVGEGEYSTLVEGEPRWRGETMEHVYRDAENYIRDRDPAFKQGWPSHMVGH
jgi:hypothetical protein